MPSAIRAVLYVRMSSTDQEGSDAQQLAWAKDACPRNGIDVVEQFIDAAKKGHETAKRTAFHRMLDYCRDCFRRGQPIEAVVCWHTNRFSRSDAIETSWFVHEFRKAGVYRMFTAERWIDFRRMEDRILFGITQDASNHPFVKELSMNSLRGRLATAEQGYWSGGAAPLGYRLEVCDQVAVNGKKKVRKRLTIDPATAPLVRRLFTAYATGETSLYQLAQRLNDEGMPTPRAAKGHCRAARRWEPTAIGDILRNEIYLGRLVWNRLSRGKFFGVVDCRIDGRDDPRTTKTAAETW